MGTIAPRKTQKRKPSLKELSNREKNEIIQNQVCRVKDANEAIERNLWLRADEIAELMQLYKRCHGRPVSAKNLRQLSGIDLDGSRQVLHGKLAGYFSSELRLKGVGMRVYERAFKFNRNLKHDKRTPFTAAELVACMKPGRDADETVFYLKSALWERDNEKIFKQRLADKQQALTDPKSVVKDSKTFLRMIENVPSFAIAAAITTIHDKENAMHHLNQTLEKLGSKYRLVRPSDKYHSHYYQTDMFDPDAKYEVV